VGDGKLAQIVAGLFDQVVKIVSGVTDREGRRNILSHGYIVRYFVRCVKRLVFLFTPALLGSTDQFGSTLIFTGEGREGVSVEGVRGFRIDTKFANYLVFAQFDQIGGGEVLAEFLFQYIGVLVADDEGDEGANIAKYGILNGFVQLSHVLISHN